MTEQAKSMTLIEIGAKVEVVEQGVRGIVTAISIRPQGISYEVVWWDGKTRKCEFLEEMEVMQMSRNTKTIGFHPKSS